MVKNTDHTPTEPQAAGVESLDDIAALGAALDATDDAPPDAPGGPPTPQPSNADELEMTLQLVRGMLLPVLDDYRRGKLKTVWTDAQLKLIAGSGAAVMDMHGWRLGAVMGKYGPYLALAASLAPPALQTYQVMITPEPRPAFGPVPRHDNPAASGLPAVHAVSPPVDG